MIYYIYYDSYGYPRKAVSAEDLARDYANDTKIFFEKTGEHMDGSAHRTACIGTVRFRDPRELREFMESMDDLNQGFYEGAGDSRPYNF